jgi:DNA modification methylase
VTAVADRVVLRTERDVIETLRGRSVTVEDIYDACEAAGVHHRDNGLDVVHSAGDTRSRRRARGVLQTLRRAGRAHRVADGTWFIDGTVESPRSMVLVICGDPSRMELVLSSAEQLLRECDEPPALILADPPWALGINDTGNPDRDNGERVYARNPEHLVGGYRDIRPEDYPEFNQRWITAAADLLQPGGYLAIITGPGQSARVQITAEDAGLTFLNQIIIPRPFALPTSRRFSHAHTVATILCAGPEKNPRRFFAVPTDMPTARSGRPYPLDVWPDVGKHERRCQVRYPTMLHPKVPARLITALTPGPNNGGRPWQALVIDPFIGGGETAVAAYRLQRRLLAGDQNPGALRLTAARVTAEA